jgi:uncharacterized membrane protein YfcA
VFEPVTIGLTFLLAGTVKGVIGLGLPTISLAILTVTLGLQPAMALLLMPSFVTNVWQAAVGGHARAIVKRTWPMLVLATATVWLGAGALTRIELSYLSALLGVLVALYAAISLTRPQITLPKTSERWAGPFAGAVNGILTGMTGSFVFPGVLYLQAIGLPRDALIQAMGIVFMASTVALAVSLGGRGLLAMDLAIASAAAVIPALIGMALGRKLRARMSEAVFRRVFFSGLLVLGLYILARSAT